MGGVTGVLLALGRALGRGLDRCPPAHVASVPALVAVGAAGVAQNRLHGGVEIGALVLAALVFVLALPGWVPPWRSWARALSPALLVATALGVVSVFVYPIPLLGAAGVLAVAGVCLTFDVRGLEEGGRRSARLVLLFRLFALSLGALAALTAGELYLRSRGTYRSWAERNGDVYTSQYDWCTKTPWLFIHEPGSAFTIDRPEFREDYKVNQDGLPDLEHEVAKPADEYRILGVGDSFTMGQGARFEEGFVRVVERELNASARAKKIVSFCAGVGGSDPVFGYQLVARRLVKYKPDLVLLVMNRSDIFDVITRGGMDRFDQDGHMHPRPRPFFEPLYARCHLLRAVVHGWLGYDSYLVHPSERDAKIAAARKELVAAARATRDLGQREGFETLVVLHPFDYQLRQPREQDDFFAPLEAAFAAEKIPSVNLTPFFEANVPAEHLDDFFWKTDMHCRAKGYQVFAHGVENALERVPGFPGSAR